MTNVRNTFIIAEAGVNHNGDINLAYRLIDVAKESGADAIKFQTFKADQVVSKYAEKADYQKTNTGNNDTQLEMIKKLELSYDDFEKMALHGTFLLDREGRIVWQDIGADPYTDVEFLLAEAKRLLALGK